MALLLKNTQSSLGVNPWSLVSSARKAARRRISSPLPGQASGFLSSSSSTPTSSPICGPGAPESAQPATQSTPLLHNAEAAGAGREAPLPPLPCLFITSVQNGVKINRSAVAKKAECLYQNVDNLIKRVGLDCVCFVTLTFPDHVTRQVEARRRWRYFYQQFFKQRVSEYVAIPERQSSGRIHFHIIAAFRVDMRSGFNFSACRAANECKKNGDWDGFRRNEQIYFRSANSSLRSFWADLRAVSSRFKIGRCETLPILSNAAALARYVGAYVSLADHARDASDYRLRTVRYALAERPASCHFSWVDGSSARWRVGLRILALILEIEHEQFPVLFGTRWAWRLREYVTAFAEHEDRALEFVSQMPEWADYPSRIRFAVHLFSYLTGTAGNPFAFDGDDTSCIEQPF